MKGYQAIKLLSEGYHSIRLKGMPEREIRACLMLRASSAWDTFYEPEYPPRQMLDLFMSNLLMDDWEVGIFDEDAQSYKWFGEIENWEKPKISW